MHYRIVRSLRCPFFIHEHVSTTFDLVRTRVQNRRDDLIMEKEIMFFSFEKRTNGVKGRGEFVVCGRDYEESVVLNSITLGPAHFTLVGPEERYWPSVTHGSRRKLD